MTFPQIPMAAIQMSGWMTRHALLSLGGCLCPSVTEKMVCTPGAHIASVGTQSQLCGLLR